MSYTKLSPTIALAGVLLSTTLLTGTILASTTVSADDSVVDNVNITVPISCNMTGTGYNSHNAEINNGQYKQDIGTTTLKVFCNDNEGFAIYANGYTNQEDGNNVLINSALTNNNTIATGTATSGDTSNWAMMLTKKTDSGDTTGENALTIDGGFNDYNNVPTAFTKVAHKNSSTSMDSTTGGATLETTYQAYINQTQSAGTYSGKVKYVLVHPADAMAPVSAGKIGVQYNANGSTFSSGATKNEVIYQENCDTMYQGNTPTISKTPNVNNDGTATTGYAYNFTQKDPVTFSGASKLKVEIDYGIENSYDYLYVFAGTYDGEVTASLDAGQIATLTGGNGSGDTQFTLGESTTLYVDGDTVTFAFFGDDYQDDGYYGYYAKVYPLYATEQSDTTATSICGTVNVDTGTYATTTDWYGSWYADINNTHYDFMDESEVISFLTDNTSTLSGTTIRLYRGLTFNEAYTRASKTQDSGYYKQQELTKSMCNTIAITQNQTLKDTRDSNTYLVGKLKDGNCWMLDNLALDPTDATTAANMNENNTNATTAAINNLLNGGSTTTGWSNTAVADVDTNFYNGGYIVPRINNASKDTLVTSYGPAATNGQAKVGLYYNYCAASASTYCYAGNQGVDVPDTDIDAPQDICPANWRMPTGGSYDDSTHTGTGEYYTLGTALGLTFDEDEWGFTGNTYQTALSTPLSGWYYYSSAVSQGSWGSWWSSTYSDGYGMYVLGVYPTYVYPDYDFRGSGYTMRCLVGE